ncbi:hypothetical protein SUGI_0004950 [Cryptomeria japonica]|uniref:non-specific lipid-transfer protein 1 n=1 Tax=Cryptomeria japonica TaxID=3369 RepID=UPI002408DAEE|nr:non-specific lipid-transfer protein 1 [Cryptomeria japonica]GLJ04860.1 hypothetical protein SUGI_0004950 [Cryptomeria japonica]
MEGRSISVMIMVMMMMVVVMIVGAGAAGGDECGRAIQAISPCLTYLINGDPVPEKNSPCCRGVTDLYAHATSTPLIQRVCNCIKTAAARSDLNDQALQNLAPSCGLHLNFTISGDIDCSTIHV